MRDTRARLPGLPRDHRYVRARHRARVAALRCRTPRARRDRSSHAAAPRRLERRRRVGPVRPDLARALAAGFLAGEVEPRGAGGQRRRRARAPPPLAHVAGPPGRGPAPAPAARPPPRARDPGGEPSRGRPGRAGASQGAAVSPTRMLTNRWRLPVLHDLADLAALLELDAGELDWFADPHTGRAPPARHRCSTTGSPTGWRPAGHPGARRPSPACAASSGACSTRPSGSCRPTTQPGVPRRRLGGLPRRAPRRSTRGAPPRPRVVLRQRHRRPRARDLAHRGLPRAGRPRAGRADDRGAAAGRLARGPAPRRPRPARRPLAPRAPPRRTPPAAGRPHLAGHRPTSRPSGSTYGSRPGRRVGRSLHPLRRRPGLLGRRRLGPWHQPPPRRRRGGRARRWASGSTRAKTAVMPRAGRQSLAGLVVNDRRAWPATRSTCSARSCTTAAATDPARRTATRCRPSPSTCGAGSPGWPSTTPRAAPGCWPSTARSTGPR